MAKLALAIAVLAVAACSAATTTSTRATSLSTAATPNSQATPTTVATPSLPSGFSDPERVAIDGAIKLTGATYLDGNVDVIVACPPKTTKCLAIQSEVDGDHAVYFRAHIGAWNRFSSACFIYAIDDASGWHFLDMACAGPESGVYWPDVGEFDYVFVLAGSCANVRATPGLTGKIVACLPPGTTVTIDGGPDYVVEPKPGVSHVWWHIQGKGWMAHEFLVETSYVP